VAGLLTSVERPSESILARKQDASSPVSTIGRLPELVRRNDQSESVLLRWPTMAHVKEETADDDATMTASGPAAEAVAIADEEEDTSTAYNDDGVVVPLGKEAEAATATSTPASSTTNASLSSSSSSEPRRRFLIRNVKCGTYLDAGGATSADPSSIYLQPRNGQPTQQFSFVEGRIQSPQGWVLAAERSNERQSYGSRVVRWTPASAVRDDGAADATWDVTAEGTILHRATGQVLGLGLNRIGWKGCKPAAPVRPRPAQRPAAVAAPPDRPHQVGTVPGR
jgi:hypothetical protein